MLRVTSPADNDGRGTGAQHVDDGPPLDAGVLSEWLDGMQRVFRDGGDSDVPCGECTACCTASQFVQIGPEETDALAHIPAELLFPAPRMPRGHVVMGYDERGRCPMLGERGCSIYEHRPQTCRTYDCRLFAATGVEPADAGIAARTVRWRFDRPTEADVVLGTALRAAAQYWREHGAGDGVAIRSSTPTELALRAVETHRRFVEADGQADPEAGSTAASSEVVHEVCAPAGWEQRRPAGRWTDAWPPT